MSDSYLLSQIACGVEYLAPLCEVFLIHAPAQQRKPVVERGGENALVTVRRDVNVMVTLAELLAVLGAEQAGMGERRGFPIEGVVESNVLRRGDEPFLVSGVSYTYTSMF